MLEVQRIPCNARSLPIPDCLLTPDNEPFHQALAEGRLLVPRCRSCNGFVWYPRSHCANCGATDLDPIELSGEGTIYSYTIVRRGLAQYATSTPYVVAYVELTEGPCVLTNVLFPDGAIEDVAVGRSVSAVIEIPDEQPAVPPILRFRLT